jgi:F-type H+-transporting ATPase subunit b
MANPAPHGQAGTQAHGGAAPHETVFPPFDSATFSSQLIWLAITFGALYLLMSRIALPRVKNILDTRAAKIAADLDAAAAAKAKADEAAVAHAKTLGDAKANAQALAQDTHARLAAETDAQRHTIEAELNGKLAAAEAQIAEMKAKAMSNVDGIARDAAAAIVQQITGKPASADAIAAAVAALKA